MKDLRISVRGNELRIIHQKYRGLNFSRGYDVFMAKNGFCLISTGYPDI